MSALGLARGRRYFARNVNGGGAGSRPPFFFLHGDFVGGGFYCLRLASHLGADQPLYALHPHGLDGRPLPATIEAMAEDHLEALRSLAPRGPYRLGGACAGGLVAYEMARRLVAAGERVDRLILINSRVSSAHLRRWPGLRDWRAVNPFRRRPAPGDWIRPWILLPSAWAYARLMIAHTPGPYAGPVTLLWSEHEPIPPGQDDATRGWGRIAPGIRVVSIPGGHISGYPRIPTIALTIRACLDGDRPEV